MNRESTLRTSPKRIRLNRVRLNRVRLNRIRLNRVRLQGLSLLEVVLAIAILGGAMVVLGQLINIGHSAAINARDNTEAQILCDAKISEVSAGILDASGASGGDITEAPGWKYTLSVEKAQIEGLLKVDCTVTQDPATHSLPVTFRLVRWIPDPDYQAELLELDAASEEE